MSIEDFFGIVNSDETAWIAFLWKMMDSTPESPCEAAPTEAPPVS
jgi:hypothetical protein